MAPPPSTTTPTGAASGDASAGAFAELAEMLGEIEAGYIGPGRRMHTPEDRAAGRYLVANVLQHAFQFWFDSDPKRPRAGAEVTGHRHHPEGAGPGKPRVPGGRR